MHLDVTDQATGPEAHASEFACLDLHRRKGSSRGQWGVSGKGGKNDITGRKPVS